MKQAILITAYRDFDQLRELVLFFDDRFHVYIHIDVQSAITAQELEVLKALPQVRYCSQDYKVRWGGLNHLHAILKLAKQAFLEEENEYFHLITGMDVPVKSNDELVRFAERESPKSYLEYFKMPAERWPQGGMDRIHHYQFYDHINAKSTFGKISLFALAKLQQLVRLKRTLHFNGTLYGGSTYWSLHRTAMEYALKYTHDQPAFLERLNHSFCGEEIYFQTVLLNSPLKEHLVDQNLRYIDWESGRGGYPAFLDETDFPTLQTTDALFARKIEAKRNRLFQMLMNR